MSSTVSRRDRDALASLAAADNEDDVDLDSLTSSEEEDVARRTEDENPLVEKVTGCRKTGTRYNSQKGFTYSQCYIKRVASVT